jgi:hypothetical protein
MLLLQIADRAPSLAHAPGAWMIVGPCSCSGATGRSKHMGARKGCSRLDAELLFGIDVALIALCYAPNHMLKWQSALLDRLSLHC